MAPAEFAEIVVLPTVREHLAARGDRRHAYLACIAAYALLDYVGRIVGLDEARKAIKKVCEPSYEVVQGICNGAKHAGSTRGNFHFEPGEETEIPRVFYGHGFYSHGRYGGIEGLEVIHNGKKFFVDWSVQVLISTLVSTYPQELATLDLSFFDVQFKPATLVSKRLD